MTERFLVDGHVHIYRCFEIAHFLESARSNLSAAARAMGVDPATPACLLLAETARDDAFARLRAGVDIPAHWRVETPDDDCAVILRRGPEADLVIVAGRQIQTREGIEVLALATDAPQSDGRVLADVLDGLSADGAPAVLPWGVGKWIGKRGDIVARALADRPAQGLLVGDNAGRPLGWPAPKPFRMRPVLPGTDPLPHAAAAADPGRYGFALDGPLDLARPAAFIRDRLRRLSSQPERFGRRVGPIGFVTGQARMRLRAQHDA